MGIVYLSIGNVIKRKTVLMEQTRVRKFVVSSLFFFVFFLSKVFKCFSMQGHILPKVTLDKILIEISVSRYHWFRTFHRFFVHKLYLEPCQIPMIEIFFSQLSCYHRCLFGMVLFMPPLKHVRNKIKEETFCRCW